MFFFLNLIHLFILFFHSLHNIIIKDPYIIIISLRLCSISPARFISILRQLCISGLYCLLWSNILIWWFLHNFDKLLLRKRFINSREYRKSVLKWEKFWDNLFYGRSVLILLLGCEGICQLSLYLTILDISYLGDQLFTFLC